MEVSYKNSFEDMVALTENLLSNSSAYKNHRYWNLFGSPILLLCIFSGLAYSKHDSSYLLGGIVGALVIFFWSMRTYHQFARKAVTKLHREQPQKEVFCDHTVTVS